MGLLGLISESPSPPTAADARAHRRGGRAGEIPPIQWRKGEMIGSSAFGQVYLRMNLDTGELLAVKQVLIGSTNATREKAQSLRAEDGSGVVHPPGRGITLRSTTLNSVQRSRTIVCRHRRRGFHDGGEGARAWELLLSLAGSTTTESLTFGAFICIKCFGAHRSPGVHISKVVSVKLDE